MASGRGLFQKVPGGTWYVRKVIPAELRPLFAEPGGRPPYSFIKSTGTTDDRVARQCAETLLHAWSREIAEMRRLGGAGPVADLPAVLAAVEDWRYARCRVAAGFAAEFAEARVRALVPAMARSGIAALYGLPSEAPSAMRESGPVRAGDLAWARAYFEAERNQGKDRGVGFPHTVEARLRQLHTAALEPNGWLGVPDFDSEFEAAVRGGGLVGSIPTKVREAARQPFARAWLEVEQHEEAERRRAAVILQAHELANAEPGSIVAPAVVDPRYAPQAGDKTVSEVIEAYKAAQADPDLLNKQAGHIFRALGEVIGGERPMRSITRADVRDVARFLETIPTNATKIYPGLPLAEAAERAAAEGRKTLAPNTIRSYLISLAGLCRFAVKEGHASENPVDGQIPEKLDKVKRRGLTREELEKVFGALDSERRANSARYWVPAVLAFSGARANEICQLRVQDIKEVDGTSYIDLSLYENGQLVEDRRLKTPGSERAIPIHSEIVNAGFLEFVKMRRESGEKRLFPDLYANTLGYYSHELSKYFGRLLDNLGLNEPSLCLHSLRHGFKDAADTVRLPDYILAALGGWGPKGDSAMHRYGSRCSPSRVKENAAHIELIDLGGFKLGPPPLAAAA